MSAFIDEVADQVNLQWAWQKVRRQATSSDGWCNEIELAGFELDLERNLESVGTKFATGVYTLKPLRPLPFPKRGDEQGELKVRQTFQISVCDQVAWAAVVNIVGPYVDSQMPPWSYGNRLYRSIWVEEDESGTKRRKIGNYRHAAGRLYLPFNQGWPIFRRHVYLATRGMTENTGLPEVDEQTKAEEEFQKQLGGKYRCPFVMGEYWQRRRPSNAGKGDLYWCALDLKQFYPSLKTAPIRDNIIGQLPEGWRAAATKLLNSMLSFPLDLSEWDSVELKALGLGPNAAEFRNIPTGLYVAGSLANAALAKVDSQVVERLANNRIAHFRYVDDHVVLAYCFDDLVEWVRTYRELLRVSVRVPSSTSRRSNPPSSHDSRPVVRQGEAASVTIMPKNAPTWHADSIQNFPRR